MSRAEYPVFVEIVTRWMDNDVYGHVNNATYYSYFDTAVNRHLIDSGALDIEKSEVFGVVVETACTYKASVAFPDVLELGLRVTKLGNSSVTYELGLYKKDGAEPAAIGKFVHVYVDRVTRRPVPIPANTRSVLQKLVSGG
jgi:acyl-CoA thioester hydrolase